MTIDVEVKMEGLDESLKAFRRLSAEFKGNNARNPINKALMSAGLPIQKDAKARAATFDDPETASRVADNIVRTRLKNPSEMFGVGIQVRTNARSADKNSRHWHFLEFGTVKMAAQPFMRPAGIAKANEARKVFARRWKKAVEDAAKKINRNLFRR